MGNLRENKIFAFEDYRLDAGQLLLYRNGEEVSLAPKAIETLLALVEHHGQIVSKSDLMERIWGNTIVEESNLAQYLYLLRRTLGKRPDGTPFIETLKRRGYRFGGAVSVVEADFAGNMPGREGSLRKGSSSQTGSEAVNHSDRRIERRGNVLAVVDWKEKEFVEENAAPVRLASPPLFRTRAIARLAFSVAGAALVLLTLSLLWRNYAAETNAVNARGDLTILPVTNGEPLDFATISPDGNYFVYATLDDEVAHLWLQQTGQANRTEIIPPFAGGIYGTTFSPDSKFIYYLAYERIDDTRSLYRIPALGGVRSRILTDVLSQVSISPSGSELVFTRWNEAENRTSLTIAKSDGTQERVLLTKTGVEEIRNGGAWSPDGKWIAFGVFNMSENDGQCTINGIDPESGEVKMLSPERWDTCFRMAWTHDSKGLVFAGTKFREAMTTRRDQIFYLSIANGESRRLTAEGNRHQYASVSVTDRDEILVVPFNRSSQIWSMDAGGDSRTATQVTNGQADGRGGIETFSDGRLSYLTRNGDGFSIWRINSDGTDRKQITTEPPAIEELRAPPDGRFYVFAARLDRRSHLYRVDASGANLKQLTFGDETQEIDSDVSPDGKWVVYDSRVLDGSYARPVLWKVPSEGGEPIRLADIDCATPRYSPDGRYVSCVSDIERKKISIVSVDNRSDVSTFDAEENAVLNVGSRWTPDGKGLAYVSFHKNVGNIWVQPVNGDRKYRLTDFTAGDIYNLAFGMTDSRLYLARGNPIRNAVLISNFR